MDNSVKEITAKLEQGVKELFNSEKYAEYLRCMSRFHNYSSRNVMLIYAQNPRATRLAGFHAWRKNFNRGVKKGEHGIKILAPVPFSETKEFEKLDPVTKQPVLDENGQPVMETLMRMGASFKPVTIFDISQTEGDPLPELVETLTGGVERYELFMDALKAVSPLPIVFEDLPEDTDGVCRFGKEIAIRSGMSQAQTVSAAIHEIAHAKVHDRELNPENANDSRREKEVTAESISYCVAQAFGIETGANSFGYVGEWLSGKEMKELNASLDIIRKTASELIESIDENYRALAKERGIDLTAKAEPEAETPGTAPEAQAEAAPSGEPQNEQSEENKVKLTPVQEQGIEIARKYARLPLEDRLNVIAGVFGCKTAKIQTSPCGGKWRGTSDMSIVFDNGNSLFIGNRRTPEAKKASVISEHVNNTLAKYSPEIVKIIKEKAIAGMKEREAIDNAVAKEKGLKPYKFLTVELNDGSNPQTSGYMGWWYVTLAVEDRIFGFLETGLCYDIEAGTVAESMFKSDGDYYVAGAVKPSEADFVYHNVGHTSKTDAYHTAISDEVRKRAEAAFAEETAQPEPAITSTRESRLYKHFAEMFPPVASGEYSYLKLESQGYDPLSIEYIGENRISVMHTYTMNGDLMYDPMIEFEIDRDARTMTAVSFEQSNPPLYQRVTEENGDGQSIDGNGRERTIRHLQADLNDFSTTWFDNLEAQDFTPVRATLAGRDGDALVTFDSDGRPITPETRETAESEQTAEPDEAFDNDRGLIANINGYIQSYGRVYDVTDDEIRAKLAEIRNRSEELRENDTQWLTYRDVGEAILNKRTRLEFESGRNTAQETPAAGGVKIAMMGGVLAEVYENGNVPPTPPPREPGEQPKHLTAEEQAANEAAKRREEILYGDDPMPDPIYTIEDMHRYGYAAGGMLPLQRETALELYDKDHTVYLLYEDGTEAIAYDREEIEQFEGFFGIEREEWENIVDFERQKDRNDNFEGSKEALLIYGKDNQFGIYQIPGGTPPHRAGAAGIPIDELRDLRFASMRELEAKGITPDRDNYTLVYTGKLDIRDTLINKQRIFDVFQHDSPECPPDFTGRSVSVSDVIVLQWHGHISAHYVDRVGFAELPVFLAESNEREPQSQAIAQPAAQTADRQDNPTLLQIAKSSEPDNGEPMHKGKPDFLAKLNANKQRAERENQTNTAKTTERRNGDERTVHGS
jgi:hypothetical protein